MHSKGLSVETVWRYACKEMKFKKIKNARESVMLKCFKVQYGQLLGLIFVVNIGGHIISNS